MTADTPRLRLGILAVVLVSLFATLTARLWYLQVLASDEYRLAANRNATRLISEPAPRGRILDRNGNVLVDNRPSNVVSVDRNVLGEEDRAAVLGALSLLLTVPTETLSERLDDAAASPYRPVPVAEDVPEETMVLLRERQDELPGVVAERVALRTYPYGPLAAHVLGYVGEINDEELAEREEEYELGDQIGKAGVERMFEAELRGVDGEVRMEVDARGVPVRVVERRSPTQGHDVVLAIDIEIQRVAEEALAQGLEAAKSREFEESGQNFVADAGSVVLLDSKEGTVVAMASYPSFDPAQLANGVTAAEAAVLFDDSTGAPYLNRTTQGQYTPGSTWKLVTAWAGLSRGLITANSTYNDRGVFTIPECVGRCTFRNSGSTPYGVVDVREALTVSSDVFFYDLGSRFWSTRDTYGEIPIQEAALALGFGADTGVPLPNEADGHVPTPASRAAQHEERPDLFPTGGWFAGDNVNMAIGQGEVAVTPIQLANAYATVANGGTRYAPNLALRVIAQDGSVVREIGPRVAAQLSMPPEMRDPIMGGLTGVTQSERPRGTAWYAFTGWPHQLFPLAGKTGTAQTDPKQDTALFAAVGPVFDPRWSVAVVMEQSGFGATAAAPVARRVLAQASGVESPTPVELVQGTRG